MASFIYTHRFTNLWTQFWCPSNLSSARSYKSICVIIPRFVNKHVFAGGVCILKIKLLVKHCLQLDLFSPLIQFTGYKSSHSLCFQKTLLLNMSSTENQQDICRSLNCKLNYLRQRYNVRLWCKGICDLFICTHIALLTDQTTGSKREDKA